jgi:protoheme IX farnesyltransferase
MSHETTSPTSSTRSTIDWAEIWQTILDYRELTKPRIVHLLVLTTVCTMLVAAKGLPEVGLLMWTLVGTTLVCGSAQVINMVWDRDIDAVMERTADRPIVQGRISVENALIFSGVLGMAGTVILSGFVNSLAALMALSGHAFYVLVYTMWLKRSTPQNIVIGGAAGAFPPLIGWAAVTGSLSWTAILIFGVIFLWTPPHFWALALYKDCEYDKAGVPMMPVARGERTTKLQMLGYTSMLIGITVLLGFVGLMGIVYLTAAIVLGAGFAYCCVRTAFDDGDTWAKRTFAYSIIYLGLLFGAMSVDSLNTQHFTLERHIKGIEQQADRIRDDRTLQELRERNGRTLSSKTPSTRGPDERPRR